MNEGSSLPLLLVCLGEPCDSTVCASYSVSPHLTHSHSPEGSAEEMADLSVSADRSVLKGREWAFLLCHLHTHKLAQKQVKCGLLPEGF